MDDVKMLRDLAGFTGPFEVVRWMLYDAVPLTPEDEDFAVLDFFQKPEHEKGRHRTNMQMAGCLPNNQLFVLCRWRGLLQGRDLAVYSSHVLGELVGRSRCRLQISDKSYCEVPGSEVYGGFGMDMSYFSFGHLSSLNMDPGLPLAILPMRPFRVQQRLEENTLKTKMWQRREPDLWFQMVLDGYLMRPTV